MLEDLLEPKEETFSYKEKDYIIKPMNIVQTDKVLKMLPSMDFKNPTESFMKVLTNDLDKIIKIAIEASQIKADVIYTMMPHQLVALMEMIISVNKPSFFLAWKRIEAAMKVSQLTGNEPSKS